MPDEKRALQRPEAWAAVAGQAARWVGLDVDLHAPRTWFGPSWALLAGVLSSGAVGLDLRSLLLLAVAWLVSEPLLGSLLALSLEVARARHACTRGPVPASHWRLPYVQPGSPGQRLLDALAQRWARLQWNWQATEGAGMRWAILALMALVLGALAGEWPGVVLAVTLLLLLSVAAGRPLRGKEREALAAAHLLVAWLVGHGTFAPIDAQALAVGVGFAAIWFAWTQRPPLLRVLAVAHLLTAGVLAALHAPLAAGGVLLLAVPLFVLLPEDAGHQQSYLRHTQAFLMASMLLAAWGLVWRL